MKKKQFRHRGCKIKIKETKKYTEIDIVMPNNTQYGKKLIDSRPCKDVPMVENEALEFQIMAWINDKLDTKTKKDKRNDREVKKDR